MATVEFSEHAHLIEQTVYKFNLQEISEPKLFRKIFPYRKMPK